MSERDEPNIRRLAKKVASILHDRGERPQRPRAPTTKTVVVDPGFLGLGRKTAERHDDGGSPAFWIIGGWRERGVFIVYTPGSKTSYYGWMAGHLEILYEDGALGCACWSEDPLGSYWVVSEFGPMSGVGGEVLDRGRWRRVKPSSGERSRQEFQENLEFTPNASGVGLFRGLKRLRDGKGIRIDGHATGMRKRLAGPS